MPLTKPHYATAEPHIPGLTRVDYTRSTGWLARYYAIRQVVHQRLFSDSRYGYDPARSRAAACRWLLACSATTAPRPRFRRVARSNTGTVGICRRVKRERSGAQVLVYDVSYQREGRRHAKIFRVHRYPSQRAALSAAITFRWDREQDMNAERLQSLRQRWEQERTQGLQERSGDAALGRAGAVLDWARATEEERA